MYVPRALSDMNHRNSAPRMARSIRLFALLMGLSSSMGVSTAAISSPSASSSAISASILFSLIVANSTSAEMTISTEAIINGSSMIQRFRSWSGALM